MKFLDIFRTQMPGILKRLEDIQNEISQTHSNIKKLIGIEKELSKQEISSNKIEKAIDDFGVALWLKDLDSHFLYVNKICCDKILKCSQAVALGMRNGDLEKDALAHVCMRSDVKVLKSQKTQRWIEHAIYSNGEHMFIDTIKSPVYDDKMKVIGIVGNAVDITNNISKIVINRLTKPGSIEIPLDMIIEGQQLIDILEENNERDS